MIQPLRHPVARYLAAVLAVFAAAGARFEMRTIVGDRQPFAIFYFAVLFSIWLCGIGPSIVAIVLSCLAGIYFFLNPLGSLRIGHLVDWIGVGMFLAVNLTIVAYSASIQHARRRLEAEIAERLRAEATIAEQMRLAQFGRDVGPALTRSDSLREMLRRCAEVTVQALDGAFARVWTVDESGTMLELQASAGLYTHLTGDHARIPVGQFKIGQIAAERKPHLTNAVIGDPRVPAQEWARREGMVAFAGYPLVVDDRLVGVLAMFARHALSDATIQMMATVANEIALGIERKHGEERLHKQREWLRVTLSSIGDGVIVTDLTGRITFLNRIAENLTGVAAADAVGSTLEEVFRIESEETRLHVENPATRALREGRVVGLANHTVLISRDGTERAIRDSAAPIRDGDGAIMGAVLVFHDAVEERAAERAVAESEARFRTMAESIPQLAWIARPDGYIEWYNKRWYEFTGTLPEDMEGWGWQSVHDPRELPRIKDKFQTALRAGEPWEDTFPLRRRDGVMRTHLSRAMPVRDEQGRIACWFGTNTDITDRIEMEEALRQAKLEADAASEAKSQFLAILSHELRTPLNPILLAATSMLENPEDPSELRSNLEMIRQYVNLQARLIDDLLDVMRIVRGKMPLHWEVADCHSLLHQAVQICRSEVFGQELRLDLDLAATDHHVNADPARLQQVFWNLIKNAVKFTPGGGLITIRSRNVVDEGDRPESIIIEVQDSGIGIEPAILPMIFDPFQQGETTITRKFGGLGLGLAICRGIIEAHGGSIAATSEGKDRGTTFTVTLTALPNATIEAGTAPASSTPAVASQRPLSLEILVVEDEPATLRLMGRLIRGLGHTVTEANSLTKALQQAESQPFDMIISDIGLPDGSGLELMRRTVAHRGPIPAIALTGYGMEEDIRRSREAGFTAHLTKPIDFSKLGAMILQLTPSR